MSLPIRESQLVDQLAGALYDFLPGKPFGNSEVSFPGAVRAAHLSAAWGAGSKRPTLVALLAATLEFERQRFCGFVVEVVRRAITYRASKTPLTREEVERVNKIVADLGFKIPELHAHEFLDSLPSAQPATAPTPTSGGPPNRTTLEPLLRELIALEDMKPVPRGTAFERFLSELFAFFELAPRGSLRLRGEQIDGSFSFEGAVYLLEAKWQGEKTGNRDLAAFNDQVASRAAWSRGLFVSYAGFSEEGLDAFARGRSTRLICMDAFDLFHVLSGALDLRDALREKARLAVERNAAFVSVRELFPKASI